MRKGPSTAAVLAGEQQQLRPTQSQPVGGNSGGSCVYYGWELLPSGAASPCGAVHSSMLDLFADVTADDVVTSRWVFVQKSLSVCLRSAVQPREQDCSWSCVGRGVWKRINNRGRALTDGSFSCSFACLRTLP
jgi:hypothetical protein